MRILLLTLTACTLASCAVAPRAADPASDAPEQAPGLALATSAPATYDEALASWQGVDDLNAWIGARFSYDFARAAKLSESQRTVAVDRVQVHPPRAFFADPSGVCVDLARFAVETLRVVAPTSRPAYLMIEFDPVVLAGNTLRRHWLVMVERRGEIYFFADSKRPGHVAGPYGSVQQFIDDYAKYRGRRIVAYRTLDSFERKLKKQAPRASREEPA